jgi:gliding motility-associated lipoprotein GldH
MMIKTRIIYLFCLIVPALSSCDRANYLINKSEAVENEEWIVDNWVPFYFSVSDTQKIYEIGFNMRYTEHYPKQNMYIFLHTVFPDRTSTHDTLSVDLFSPAGEPYGKGRRVKELHQGISYVKFPMPGDYTMFLEQAMRMDTLPGVVSVGLYLVEPTE